MTGRGGKGEGAKPETQAECFYTVSEDQSAALSEFSDALGCLAELAGCDATEEMTLGSLAELNRGRLGALFGMLRRHHLAIVGPGTVGYAYIDPGQIKRDLN